MKAINNSASFVLLLLAIGTICAFVAPLRAAPGDPAPGTGGYRLWTQQHTGKQIEGRVKDKKLNGSEVLIVRKSDGRSVWLDAQDLVEADREYIKLWVRPESQVTARVTASGRPGWKKVRVTIISGTEDLEVKITGRLPGPHRFIAGLPRPPFSRKVGKGQTVEFEFACGAVYAVEALENGTRVDMETDKIKTAL